MWWEHWKKKIYDQENIIDFFITPPQGDYKVYLPDEKTAGS